MHLYNSLLQRYKFLGKKLFVISPSSFQHQLLFFSDSHKLEKLFKSNFLLAKIFLSH